LGETIERNIGCIGRRNVDGSINILLIKEKEGEVIENKQENESNLPILILEGIQNKTAVAAIDATIEGTCLAIH